MDNLWQIYTEDMQDITLISLIAWIFFILS